MTPAQRPSSRVKANLAANFLGQGWRALMSLLFVPFYLRILGVEAYGLIGLYTSLQLALALLDAGLRPALAREMARFTGGAMDARAIRTLLRSIELPLFALSALIVTIMFVAAPWLATNWIHPQSLDQATVIAAFRFMGLVAAAQFLEAAYDSSLSGLQRQVVQNAIVTFIATLRGFGALAVLWAVPHLTAFFLWQGAIALLSCLMLALAVYRSLPAAEGPVRFSLNALRSIRSYASGMLGIAILALLLTQSDKFVLAHYVSLSEVTHYTLAASLVGAVAMLSGPIINAFFPRLTQLRQEGDHKAVEETFHRLSGIMALIVGSATAVFVMFGERLLNAWIHNSEFSAQAAPIVSVLSISVLFNTLSSLPYVLQLANGVTGIVLRINLAILIVLMPSLIVMISLYGGVGAALCAVGVNLTGLTLSAAFTFPKYLPGAARRWWLIDLLRPLVLVFAAAFGLSRLLPTASSAVLEVSQLALCGALTLSLGALFNPEIRNLVLAPVRRLILPLSAK